MNTNNFTCFNAAKAAALLLCTTTLSSCGNDTDEMLYSAHESSVLSDEILEKISYGCDESVYYTKSDTKVETSASDEYMEVIRERLESITGYNKSIGFASQMVGVIKADDVRGCGKYDEIEVFYDCQDHSANNTYSHGFKGLWDVTQNIKMKYCVVPSNLFNNTNKCYGVVALFDNPDYLGTNSQHDKVACLDIFMDAEDEHGHTSHIKHRTYGGNWEPEVKQYGSFKFDSHKNLAWRMFVFTPQNFSVDVYPDLGFDYGVFGNIYSRTQFCSDYGEVYSDDEDHNNTNRIKLTYNNGSRSVKNENYFNIILLNRNTRLFLSKISAK